MIFRHAYVTIYRLAMYIEKRKVRDLNFKTTSKPSTASYITGKGHSSSGPNINFFLSGLL